MTRKFWGIIMIGSLLIVIGSAAYLFRAMQNKSFQSVPLAPVSGAASSAPAVSTAPVYGPAVNPPPTSALGSASGGSLTGAENPAPQAATETAATGIGAMSDKNVFSPDQKSEKKARPGFKLVTFIYQPAAKSVYLVGSFKRWFRKPLQKTVTGMWAVNCELRPGTYQYLFVVNGKRVKDPAPEALVSKDGKTNLIVVK
jgi:hypothetical protein